MEAQNGGKPCGTLAEPLPFWYIEQKLSWSLQITQFLLSMAGYRGQNFKQLLGSFSLCRRRLCLKLKCFAIPWPVPFLLLLWQWTNFEGEGETGLGRIGQYENYHWVWPCSVHCTWSLLNTRSKYIVFLILPDYWSEAFESKTPWDTTDILQLCMETIIHFHIPIKDWSGFDWFIEVMLVDICLLQYIQLCHSPGLSSNWEKVVVMIQNNHRSQTITCLHPPGVLHG